jgi:hypothetical protein
VLHQNKAGKELGAAGEHESGRKIDRDLNANRKGQGIGKQNMMLRHEGTKAERMRRTGAGTWTSGSIARR